MRSHATTNINRRTLLASTAAAGAVLAMPAIVRAQSGPLKVGSLLPRSGVQALIGQDCQRAVELAPAILKSLGLPELTIMNADTETNVDTARSRAERLINDGAQMLVGAFDSGQSSAIAQVAEQKGIPYVVNIAAAPPITEQGYKFVFRNFPTAPMILTDAFINQKEVFETAGVAPKSVVLLHVNDTFGMAMLQDIDAMMPKFNMPYTIVDKIAYDPAARDLSVEISKAKATGAEALLVVGRLNDAILLTREMVKQRWSPMAVLSMGPGWNENDYFKTLGKLANGPMSFIPWYDPTKPLSKTVGRRVCQGLSGSQPERKARLHVRGPAGRSRRLQARRFDRPQGDGRGDPHDQYHQQRQHRPGDPVQRQGPERQAQERGYPEPRREIRHAGAEGRVRRQARIADDTLRQARLKSSVPPEAGH